MWFTVYKLGETSWCSVKSETCNQYSARRANGQLTAEQDNSMCFHDHKVGRVPNNVHNGKQRCVWSWTHCNLCLTGRGPSCTCGFVHSQGHLSLFISLHHNYVSHDAKLQEAHSKIYWHDYQYISQILWDEIMCFDSVFPIKAICIVWINGIKAEPHSLLFLWANAWDGD